MHLAVHLLMRRRQGQIIDTLGPNESLGEIEMLLNSNNVVTSRVCILDSLTSSRYSQADPGCVRAAAHPVGRRAAT